MQGRAQLLTRQIQREVPYPTLLASATTLLSQSQRAVLLSETLLDMAHLEAGSFTLDVAECDLVVVAHDILDDMGTTTGGYTFLLEAPPSVLMRIDESRIRQVLRNILDNAVKYTPADAGPIVLHIELLSTAGVQIRIVDSGPGVPSDELPHLFERRYRASNAMGHGTSGSGLGLYIVRQLVEAHGGTIHAEQASQGGLEFTIFLPYIAASS